MFSALQKVGLADCVIKLFFFRCLRFGFCVWHVVAILFFPWPFLCVGLFLHFLVLLRAASYLRLLCDRYLVAALPPDRADRGDQVIKADG